MKQEYLLDLVSEISFNAMFIAIKLAGIKRRYTMKKLKNKTSKHINISNSKLTQTKPIQKSY